MFHIRPLTGTDLPWALQLSRQAGWNQTPADWQRAIELEPAGCFAAVDDTGPVGTTTVCSFGSVAWIALVLVDVAARGKGYGRALLQHALDYCDQRRIDSVRLDATELGRPLYEKLGFAAQFELARYAGRPLAIERHSNCRPAVAEDLPRIVACDATVARAERGKFLRALWNVDAGAPRLVEQSGRLLGFAISRPGFHAAHIGPVLGEGEAGESLLADVLCRHAGQTVYVDVPSDHVEAVNVVERSGLAVQRRLMRMTRGRLIWEPQELLWASSGPEKG